MAKPEATIKFSADKKSVNDLKVLALQLQTAFLNISIQFEEMKKAIDKYIEEQKDENQTK